MKVSYATLPECPSGFCTMPEDRYVPFKRKARKPQEPDWVAPEHQKFARHMQRAFPLDDKGNPMKELGKRLVLDPRPEILQPKRQPIFLGLDQSAT